MKITPTGATPPAMPQTMTTSNNTEARAKAIAMLSGAPVPQNQNAITPEETIQTRPQSPAKSALQAAAEQATEIAEQSDATTAIEETTEEQAVETKPKVDPAVSRLYAQLARQEQAARNKAAADEKRLEAREQALTAKEAALQSTQDQYKQGYISLDQLKSNTMDILAQAGVSYDDLTQQILNQPQRDPRTDAHIARLEAEIKKLSEKTEASQKTYEEQQTASYQAAVRQIEADVNHLVYTDPAFETIKGMGQAKEVVKLIEETFKNDGVLMTVEEAAQEVEDYLLEETLKTVEKIDKIKKRLAQNVATNAKVLEKKTQAPAATNTQQTQMKTLTNATSSTRQLSAKERAILAFKGELAKS